MSITTATELKTALANWLKRDDLTDRLDEFIALAEAGLNRVLRCRSMEASFASVALVSGAATLPTDFLAFKELRYDGTDDYTLQPVSIEWLRDQASDDAGYPLFYAVGSTSVYCWPTSGSITGTYYQKLSTLTANSTNWLLTSHPDLYLSACLVEAWLYGFDEAKAAFWRQRQAGLIGEIQQSDDDARFSGGPLTVRTR